MKIQECCREKEGRRKNSITENTHKGKIILYSKCFHMKDYFRESVRRDIPNWGKVDHCKNHNMYVNTRLSWEGRLTRKSLDFDFQLNLDDHWPTTWRLSWKGGQLFSFNNPRSKITFNFEQSTKEDLRTLYSKKKTSWCFLESQSMECKWSKNKILYNAVNIKCFPNY